MVAHNVIYLNDLQSIGGRPLVIYDIAIMANSLYENQSKPVTIALTRPSGGRITPWPAGQVNSFLDAMRLKINRMCSAFSMPKLRSGLILQVFRAVRG